jgi:hypothetical protein
MKAVGDEYLVNGLCKKINSASDLTICSLQFAVPGLENGSGFVSRRFTQRSMCVHVRFRFVEMGSLCWSKFREAGKYVLSLYFGEVMWRQNRLTH